MTRCWIFFSCKDGTASSTTGSSTSSKENSYEKFVDKLSYTEIGVPWAVGSIPIFIEMATLDVAPLPRGLVGISTIFFIVGGTLLVSKLYLDLFVKGKKDLECDVFFGWLCNIFDGISGWLHG